MRIGLQKISCVALGRAGTYSDGKLHFSPVLSHEKMLHLFSIKEYQKYLDEIDKIFTNFGVDSEYYPKDIEKAKKLVEEAKKHGIRMVIRKIRHIGTDKLPFVIKNFQDFLEEKGVNIMPNSCVTDLIVVDNVCKGVLLKGGENLNFDKIICAPGRVNAKWLQEISIKNKMPFEYDKVEVGVRVEFPATVMAKYSDLMYEAIFIFQSKTFEDVVRTFCHCPNGMVGVENYEGFVCVNGHSNSTHLSENSNFTLVSEITLTEPVENTTEYAKSIAQLATTIGSGKPILRFYKVK